MSIYTREVQFTVPSDYKSCVVMPIHMRAALGTLCIKQVSGTLAGYSFRVLDRRGACANAIDWYVLGGAITGIADNGAGKCRFTVTEANMLGLKVGDTVEVKGTDVDEYNVLTHTVTRIVSATTFDTDADSNGAATGGWWQTAPLVYPTVDPDVHQVVSLQTVAAQAASKSVDANRLYQNRDNQSITARRMQSALYLEIEPEGTGDKDFVLSYTAEARSVTD